MRVIAAFLTALSAAVQALPPPINDTTNYTPRWAPDSRRLVFSRRDAGRWALYVIDVDGTGLRRITPSDATFNDREPSWSPDGRRVAFDSDRNGNRDIYAMDVDRSTGVRVLAAHPGIDRMPSWSPDGRTIVFVSDRSGSSELWSVHADGQEVKRITEGSTSNDVLRPAWSPRGDRIAYAANRLPAHSNPLGRRQIFVVEPDGRQLRGISEPAFDGNCSWAPDGRRLACDGSPDNEDDTSRGQWELFIIDAASGVRTRLTQNSVNDWGPSWSPDGRWIAYASGLNNQYEIYVIDASGASPRRVTRLVYP